MPDFACQMTQSVRPFSHYWEHTVGSGHAPLALRADWQDQMRRAHDDLGFRHVRFHAILSDEMGTLICEEDKLLYSFFNADQIIDFLLSIGMRPFVELSFMPEALASGHNIVFRYRGNITAPKEYSQWSTLIQKLVAHWVDRYGLAEVREWFFEVWNEPNLTAFGTGLAADYFKLYDSTAKAIKSVDPSLKVGGPATADNAWIPEFLTFCKANALPVDFVSTHHYPTDAFGTPGADTITQLEHAPRTAMKDQVARSRAQAGGLPLYYTEWNITSNPRDPMHDEPFAAAFATRIIMEAQGLADGYSYWTFTDIFSENYFPSVPFHGGFGLMNLHGIPKPVYRAFELLHRLGTEQLTVDGAHETVTLWAIRKDRTLTVLITNLAMPRHSIQSEFVHVRLTGSPEPRMAWVERIDEDHANPRRLWKSWKEPEYLSRSQVDQLTRASTLQKEPIVWSNNQGVIDFTLLLPPQSVAAVTFEFA